jgi:hypothetical protein
MWRTPTFPSRSCFILLVGLVMASYAHAQTPSIHVGDAVLRLGMTVADVHAELARHPPMTLDEKNGSISNGDRASGKDLADPYTLYAEVEFTQGRLSRVEKSWRLNGSPDTSASLASTIYAAVSSMTGNITQTCTVHPWSASAPAQDYQETEIECDSPAVSRSVHVFTRTSHSSAGEFSETQVTEAIEIP